MNYHFPFYLKNTKQSLNNFNVKLYRSVKQRFFLAKTIEIDTRPFIVDSDSIL